MLTEACGWLQFELHVIKMKELKLLNEIGLLYDYSIYFLFAQKQQAYDSKAASGIIDGN